MMHRLFFSETWQIILTRQLLPERDFQTYGAWTEPGILELPAEESEVLMALLTAETERANTTPTVLDNGSKVQFKYHLPRVMVIHE